MTDLMCQTLTSLANIAWAEEDYRQAAWNLNFAFDVEVQSHHQLLPYHFKIHRHRSMLHLGIVQVGKEVILDVELEVVDTQGEAADRDQEFIFLFHLPKNRAAKIQIFY